MNGRLDSQKYLAYYPTVVVSKFNMKGIVRGSRRLHVHSWRDGQKVEGLAVDADDFDRFQSGDKVTVAVEPGALGIPWYYGVYRRWWMCAESVLAHSSQLTAHSSQLTAHSSQLTAPAQRTCSVKLSAVSCQLLADLLVVGFAVGLQGQIDVQVVAGFAEAKADATNHQASIAHFPIRNFDGVTRKV